MIELTPEFSAQLPPGVDAFDYIMQLDGEMFRDIDNRRTLRFSLGGRRYFLKAHYGVGWKEIIKNLLQFRLPVLGARNEWRAIRRLQELGVDTMDAGRLWRARHEPGQAGVVRDHRSAGRDRQPGRFLRRLGEEPAGRQGGAEIQAGID